MTKTTILLDEDRKIKLSRQARVENATMSEIIRKALDYYIGEPSRKKLGFQAIGNSNLKTISQKDEEYLFKKTK